MFENVTKCLIKKINQCIRILLNSYFNVRQGFNKNSISPLCCLLLCKQKGRNCRKNINCLQRYKNYYSIILFNNAF